MSIKYREPKFEEFVIGFKFESSFWLFTKTEVANEWAEAEITKDNIEDFKRLYFADAYPSEFRVKKVL